MRMQQQIRKESWWKQLATWKGERTRGRGECHGGAGPCEPELTRRRTDPDGACKGGCIWSGAWVWAAAVLTQAVQVRDQQVQRRGGGRAPAVCMCGGWCRLAGE